MAETNSLKKLRWILFHLWECFEVVVWIQIDVFKLQSDKISEYSLWKRNSTSLNDINEEALRKQASFQIEDRY